MYRINVNVSVTDQCFQIELSELHDTANDSVLEAVELARYERQVMQEISNGELEISEVLPPHKMALVNDILAKREPSVTSDGSEPGTATLAAEEAQFELELKRVKMQIAKGEVHIPDVLPPSKMRRVEQQLAHGDSPPPPSGPKHDGPEQTQTTELLTRKQFEANFEKNHQKFDDYIAARAIESPTVKERRDARILERREAKAAKTSGLWNSITSTISSSFSLTTNSLLWGDPSDAKTDDDTGSVAQDDATDQNTEDDMTSTSGLLSSVADSVSMSFTRMWRILIQKAGFPCA